MRTLEDELGAQLFERHGRGVRLTPAGQALVRPAQRTLRAFAQAAGAVRGAGDDGFAQLRIVTNTVWALDPLVRVVGELGQLHPRLQLQISDPAGRTVVVEQVRNGEARSTSGWSPACAASRWRATSPSPSRAHAAPWSPATPRRTRASTS